MEHSHGESGRTDNTRRVCDRFYQLREIFRFLTTGVLGTVLTYVVYLGALSFFSYPVAYAICFVAGLVFITLANVRIVFGRRLSVASIAAYAFYYVAYYLLNLVGISLVIEHAGISAGFAPLFVLPVTVPLHYVVSRYVLGRFQAWREISSEP